MSVFGEEYNELGFKVLEASFSGSVFGKVFEIPSYLTDLELDRIADLVSTEAIDSDVYPNVKLWENRSYESAFDKTKVLWDNWDTICRWTDDANLAHISGHSAFQYIDESPSYIRERLQSSPAHMREYEPHTDYGSKGLTILVPIAPGVSEPTRFHGTSIGGTFPRQVRTIPWEVNHAYMFRPSANHSWHSYIGGDNDRCVLNINFMN